MTECEEKVPGMPASVADAWAAVYIDVGEKLEKADNDALPGDGDNDKDQ
ncbi:MAG: hypothetical protein HQ567_13355 [Candidatus Nealsonbacteria bacterium]|nr:hypothetical protein [Candidatus Nealsonbacteria bacterium]